MEVPARIELAHKGFADLSLTTWARHHEKNKDRVSGRRDSNSRHLAWEANALPLNYSRVETIITARHDFVKPLSGRGVPLLPRSLFGRSLVRGYETHGKKKQPPSGRKKFGPDSSARRAVAFLCRVFDTPGFFDA